MANSIQSPQEISFDGPAPKKTFSITAEVNLYDDATSSGMVVLVRGPLDLEGVGWGINTGGNVGTRDFILRRVEKILEEEFPEG